MISIVFFDDAADASSAFDQVRGLDGVQRAVTVGRDAAGSVTVERGAALAEASVKTGLLGGLIGALGGPLGALLGATAGSIVGDREDTAGYERMIDGIAVLSERIRPGTFALMAETDGDQSAAIAEAVGTSTTSVLVLPADEVDAEVAEFRQQIDESAAARTEQRDSQVAALQAKRAAFSDRVSRFFGRTDRD